MTNLILLVSDDHNASGEFRSALTRTSRKLRLELATQRAEIEGMDIPILILLDLMLARESATGILRWLRTEPQYQAVPVFALALRAGDVKEAYALGANSCIVQEGRGGLAPIAHGIAAYASLLA
jgi:DNA-binding response OmpR family regulator